MTYKFNPKTQGSGIICCIPQSGRCPNNCKDCFFQSGRSYLEPLEQNLPNIPTEEQAAGRIVRVNDGNDSSIDPATVIMATRHFKHKFYNTAINSPGLARFPGPVVLTVNPGEMTDREIYHANISKNLMMVRVRTNTWNMNVVDKAIDYYTLRDNPVPVILTFMAYHGPQPLMNDDDYVLRKRTMNSYWAITSKAWKTIMEYYGDNHLVYSCGKEGEGGATGCRFCGNCLREYFATMERMREGAVKL
jgi:hypothetical protein